MKAPEDNYIEINRQSWNARAENHMDSAFYDVEGFLKGNTSLKEIELLLLGDLTGKSLLHLQCHFGQDTLSLARMGAKVTGADLSDTAIQNARELAVKAGLDATFVCCDVYDLPKHIDQQFDVVFTTYGTIGWLPDLDKWARVIAQSLKPGGKFIFAEFHPVVWMFDDNFKEVAYRYFKSEAIIETGNGTYADKDSGLSLDFVSWNHGIAEVLNSLLQNGLQLRSFHEYDYSPYDCFSETIEFEPGKFRIRHFGDKIPMVYALEAEKL